MEKRFFSEQGLDVSPTVLDSSTALLNAVVSGTIHFGVVDWLALFNAYNEGLPVVAVAPGTGSVEGFTGIITLVFQPD